MSKIYYSETCPTCGRGPGTPYRSHDRQGKIVQGCIDGFHTGHLVSPSESSFWHNRQDAKKIRAANKKARHGCTTQYMKIIEGATEITVHTLP